MNARLLIAATVLASVVSAAEEPVSRLRYTAPEGWTLSSDGRTLLPPGGNAAVTFAPSEAFAGTADEWMAESWNSVLREMKLVSGPAPGTQGAFLTRLGLFQQATGANVWLVVHTLVKDGRGECVIYLSGDETQFRAHMPALSKMLRGVTVASSAGATPAGAPPPPDRKANEASGTPTMNAYDFLPPQGWQVQRDQGQILLTQSADPAACKIQLLAPQPTSGDLEQDSRGVFATMYPGWAYTRTGEKQYVLSRGFLPKGLEYFMMEAQMSATSADGRYVLEDGAALVVKAGSSIVIIAARHGGLMAHTDCVNKYETWRRFFNSFTVKNAPAPARHETDVASRIIGAWSQAESRAISEYVFAANGNYGFIGALGSSYTTSDLNYEYLHLKSYAFDGAGSYALAGDTLALKPRRGGNAEQRRFRFEQVNHGGTGWKDRLYLLTKDRVGENEVCYERKGAPTPKPPAAASGAAVPASGASIPSVAARQGQPIPEAAEVAGFYRLTKRVYNYNLAGSPGSGHTGFRLLYYLLSTDGRVFRGVNQPDLVDGDIGSFDFDAARRRSPKDAGTYKIKGDEVILTMGEAPPQIVVATRSRDALKVNDPAFTYGEFTFFRSVRALPEPARGPAKPPEVVRVPAASIPAAIEGWPTLVYQAPPGFKDPTGRGRHESIATGQARVEVYDFRRFRGKNLEQEFRATRFREWLPASSREEEGRIVGEPVFEPQTMDGAEQVFSATFQDGSEALRDIVDTGAPRVRSRFAILAAGAVALVDLMIRDGEALQNQQAGLNAFSESLKILPAPPSMTREDILAVAGVWEWDGWSGFGKEALPHEEQAQIESYVFSVDGRVVWDHGRPDFRTFDFARAAAAENTVGTYFKRGNQLVLRFGAPPYYVYSATIKGRDTLEILGYTYHRRQSVEAK